MIRRVLSIDGGGIRGVIPAHVLAHIESVSGLRAAQLFDLIVGTSTGGILALGLTMPGRAKSALCPGGRGYFLPLPLAPLALTGRHLGRSLRRRRAGSDTRHLLW